MRVLERFVGTRIVALPAALDAAVWPPGALVLRLAPDEALVAAEVNAVVIGDADAIIERETGFSSVWLEDEAARDVLERECDWELPTVRPAFAQGMVAGLPVKMWLEHHRVLFVVASPFAADLTERLR